MPAIRPLAELEEEAILSAVEICGGNLCEAARRLELSRSSLYRKLEKYGFRKHFAKRIRAQARESMRRVC